MNGPLVVVGDTLLDRDVDGTVSRICPDAPAPVLDERTATDRPGGAGLAALLAAADGGEVALVTALADDAGGVRLAELLTDADVALYPMRLPGATAEKIRLRAGGQTLLRLDRGGDPQPPGEPSPAVRELLGRAGAILVSDYGRGLLRQPALRAALAEASAPVVWDPHPRGPAPVSGTRLTTPNLDELRRVTGDAGGGSALTTATRAGQELRRRWRVGAVAVTMGPDGAVLCHAGGTPVVLPPASVPEHVEDTCGAGDRFAAAAALALGEGAPLAEAVRAAVEAASAYVAAGGAAGLRRKRETAAGPDPARTAEDLIARVRADGGTVVATGGCFDILHAGHLSTLRAARRLGDCLIVCLNSDSSVRGLKGPDRPVNPAGDRARLLAALDCVDAVVVFDEPTPHQVLARLRPDVWVKGGDYGDVELPEAELVRRWGGRVVTVPYLAGRSTTGTISAARQRGLHLVRTVV
ncbi:MULTISPECIES: PfkB family carbohydrate kinase [unclassified Micromonospora]|uniref:PfkB family carbohydrate kinase n=1 Tax=unclassified Micromonospora TaxID=2617518 RepID=UPI001B36ED5A|nr:MULTISPECIES: PfkB family carbohydrate kinase [unclassified Micromonospora]MBQ1046343.1 bifunctional heptose 7-phosphate kinase/heptose 1-phosphate adenyltransferase [Micromonospora sp. C72]MBQ1056387.1 bifunctional heptose 7-phosphate kinase/heptose 1-phosphate adenyltransferase [Micromonospora sp. C32]